MYEKLSCTITPESISLLNCEIYQRGRVSTVADTELILTIADLIVRQMSKVQLTTTTSSDSWVGWEGQCKRCLVVWGAVPQEGQRPFGSKSIGKCSFQIF